MGKEPPAVMVRCGIEIVLTERSTYADGKPDLLKNALELETEKNLRAGSDEILREVRRLLKRMKVEPTALIITRRNGVPDE